MNRSTWLLAFVTSTSLSVIACGDDEANFTPPGGAGHGGSSSGGSSSGGSSSGGSSSGGTSKGGSANGGSSSGGSSGSANAGEGGADNGGAAGAAGDGGAGGEAGADSGGSTGTGGSAIAGSAGSGGVANGGSAGSGGVANGGSAGSSGSAGDGGSAGSGGSAIGGNAGSASGGDGGSANGGSAGSANGGNGGAANGGSGGSAGSGGAASGGTAGASSGGNGGSAGDTDPAGGSSGSSVGGSTGMGGNEGDAGAGGEAGDGNGTFMIEICPGTTTLLPGDVMDFNAHPIPSAEAVTYSAPDGGMIDADTGVFTAPGPGTYTVVATMVDSPATQAVSTVTVVASPLPSVSGTVNYLGQKTGRVFVSLQGWPGGSTTIDGPGSFTIRGANLPMSGQASVMAHMDTLDASAFVAGANPLGVANFEVSGDDVIGVEITLVDPDDWTPIAPTNVGYMGVVGDYALLSWDRIRPNDRDAVEGYRIYVSTSPNPGVGNNVSLTEVRATADTAFIPGLTLGGTYYFGVAGTQNNMEGPVASIGPVTLTVPTGPNYVSGSVDITGVSGPGQLFAFVFSQQTGVRASGYVSPQNPQPFLIEGVPNGNYNVGAIFKVTGSPELTVPDLVSFNQSFGPMLTVQDGDVDGLSIQLASDDALGQARTIHRYENGSHNYQIDLRVISNARRVVKSTLAASPDFEGPIDMGLSLHDQGQFHWSQSNIGIPTVGNSYRFDVMYADGETCNVTASVTAVLPETPIAISPIDTGSTSPLFEWEEPLSVPAGAHYELSVWTTSGPGGGTGIWYTELPVGTTSIQYNADGRALAAALEVGATYYWDVRLVDGNSNSAIHSVSFVVQGN